MGESESLFWPAKREDLGFVSGIGRSERRRKEDQVPAKDVCPLVLQRCVRSSFPLPVDERNMADALPFQAKTGGEKGLMRAYKSFQWPRG